MHNFVIILKRSSLL